MAEVFVAEEQLATGREWLRSLVTEEAGALLLESADGDCLFVSSDEISCAYLFEAKE